MLKKRIILAFYAAITPLSSRCNQACTKVSKCTKTARKRGAAVSIANRHCVTTSRMTARVAV